MTAKTTKKKINTSAAEKKVDVRRFVIDFSSVCSIKIDMAFFHTFLSNHIKVDGKILNLKDRVELNYENHKMIVTVVPPFSKRYLKYLTKKYLKSYELRDYMRVVSTDKTTYKVKYFKSYQ